jgi:hypothetical protein
MLSFKQFINLKEEEKPNHIGSLEDELGINPKDFEKVPQMGANFRLDGKSFSASPYKILDYVKNAEGKITHAKIQLINDPANKLRKQFSGNNRLPDNAVKQVFTVPINKLNDFISNGLSSNGGGDMGMGMGGMGGGMGGM